MRKVLLTTTALVALGGVSAASAIDISGNYQFDYVTTSNSGASADAANESNDTLGSDGLITFSGESTSDAGLTFGAKVTMQTNSTSGNQAVAVEDQGAYISGDFGYIMMGQTDGLVDVMDNHMHSGNIVENGAGTANSTVNSSAAIDDSEGAAKIGYRSPEVSGFQFGLTYADAGAGAAENDDTSAWIVTYDLGVAKLGYASSKTSNDSNSGADITMTNYGVGTSVAGIGINIGFGTDKTAGAAGAADTSKIDTRDVELSYSMDAVSLFLVNVNSEEKTGDNAGDKMTGTTYGLSYSIAPGVSAFVEHATTDYTDATTGGTNSDGRNQTQVTLSVNF
jgi:hypothetical protein